MEQNVGSSEYFCAFVLAQSVYWKKGGLAPGSEDRIVPFMVYKNGHMGPLYGAGRMGWYPVHDFKPTLTALAGRICVYTLRADASARARTHTHH